MLLCVGGKRFLNKAFGGRVAPGGDDRASEGALIGAVEAHLGGSPAAPPASIGPPRSSDRSPAKFYQQALRARPLDGNVALDSPPERRCERPMPRHRPIVNRQLEIGNWQSIVPSCLRRHGPSREKPFRADAGLTLRMGRGGWRRSVNRGRLSARPISASDKLMTPNNRVGVTGR